MKQTIITLLLLIAATVANAQTKDEENFSKRLFEAKLAEVSLKLNLNDEQKEKFTPIYEQYCNEMGKLRENPRDSRPPMDRPGMRRGGRPEGPGMQPDGHGRRGDDPAKMKDKKNKKDNADMKDKAEKKEKKDKADKQEAGRKEQMSDADKVKHMKERMEKQKRAQEIRLGYTDKFAAVLTDEQLLKFYEVEDDIQRKMRERARKVHGPAPRD